MSMLSATIQTHSQLLLASDRVVPYQQSFPLFSWTGSRGAAGEESAHFRGLRITSVLFADGVVLLSPSDCDLLHAIGQFAAECEAAWVRNSISLSFGSLLENSGLLPLDLKVKEFNYLESLFISGGKMEHEIDRQIGQCQQ